MKIKNAYFIGIGGAGMSGIAKVLKEMGLNVSGSDIKESRNTDNLRALGINVIIGHKKENIKKYDAIVISSAIPESNPELVAAKEKKLKIYKRAEMLAEIAKERYTIAISGTHGKTTTTSMVSFIFEKANLDPTFLIGGELNDIGGNAKFGKSKYLIAETDESDGSLLHLNPDVLVVTNIEADHLDYFKNFEAIKELFIHFLSQIKPSGFAVLYGDHPNVRAVMPTVKSRFLTYGYSDTNDFAAKSVEQRKFAMSFSPYYKNKKLGSIKLRIPGEHNVLNSLAAITVGLEAGIKFKEIAEILASFKGVTRRFQLMGKAHKVLVYDDYAHHPTEISATLKAASNGDHHRIICVFQPHRYSRTQFLVNEFSHCFNDADVVIVTEIYGAGEDPMPGVSSKLIVDRILENHSPKKLAYLPKLADVTAFLEAQAQPGDLIITMGAGDVWTVGQEFTTKAVS